MARELEAEVLRQIIEIVRRNHKSIVPSEVTGFVAMVGDRYSGELMVVGRAVNVGRTWAAAVVSDIEPNYREVPGGNRVQRHQTIIEGMSNVLGHRSGAPERL
jgi:hypothetical protein